MKKKIITGIIILISILSISLYKMYSYDKSSDINLIAIYVDDVLSNNIPNKGDGYILDRYECSDNTQLKWNYDSWSVVLKDFKPGTSCTYYFKKGSIVNVDNKLDEGKETEEKEIEKETIGVPEGKKVKDLEKPTREGYTFQGWYDQNGNLLNDEDYITNDMNVTAKWTINTYKLTIQTNEGTVNGYTSEQVINLKYKEQYELKTMTRKGYTFTSFDVSNNSTKIKSNVLTMGSSDTTIKANWSINSYTLTIVDTCNNTSETKTVKYNETINISEPVCTGYTLTGQSVDKGTYESNKYTATDSNATLVFTWTINNYPYIVKHYKQNIDGVNYTLVESDTQTGSAKYYTTISPDTKQYTGFTSPSKKSLTIQVDDTTYKKNKVEYNYTRNKYSLTLNANGGTLNGSAPSKMYYEETTTINNPSKACHTFTNWTVSSGTLTDKTFKMGTSNATLTANYSIIKYNITFNVNGGDSLSSNTRSVNCGQAIGTLPTPTRSKYEFDGWYTQASGGTKVTDTTLVDENMTLFAHWYSNEYTVSFDINGGTGRYGISSNDPKYKQMSDQTITYNVETALLKNEYFKDGDYMTYDFIGWSETPTGPVKYTDQAKVLKLTPGGTTKTLYAQYEAIEQDLLVGKENDIESNFNYIHCHFVARPEEYHHDIQDAEYERYYGKEEETISFEICDGDTCKGEVGAEIRVDWVNNKFNYTVRDYMVEDFECRAFKSKS